VPKQARLSGIKSFRCYTKAEAATLVGVSTRTIGNWTRDGLRLLDESHPALIRGDDLRNYITAQRESRKVHTELCEIYCAPCRKSRPPAGGIADCEVEGNKAKLTALCGVCERIVSKPISLASLTEISAKLDLTITRVEVTL
jgi:DNA-binding XRE family transcriptional regulator